MASVKLLVKKHNVSKKDGKTPILDDYISRDATGVNVRSLSPGIYIMQTITDSRTYSVRFVIRRK